MSFFGVGVLFCFSFSSKTFKDEDGGVDSLLMVMVSLRGAIPANSSSTFKGEINSSAVKIAGISVDFLTVDVKKLWSWSPKRGVSKGSSVFCKSSKRDLLSFVILFVVVGVSSTVGFFLIGCGPVVLALGGIVDFVVFIPALGAIFDFGAGKVDLADTAALADTVVLSGIVDLAGTVDLANTVGLTDTVDLADTVFLDGTFVLDGTVDLSGIVDLTANVVAAVLEARNWLDIVFFLRACSNLECDIIGSDTDFPMKPIGLFFIAVGFLNSTIKLLISDPLPLFRRLDLEI